MNENGYQSDRKNDFKDNENDNYHKQQEKE